MAARAVRVFMVLVPRMEGRGDALRLKEGEAGRRRFRRSCLGGGRRGRRTGGRKRHGADQQRGEHEADGVAHVCPLGCGANVFFDLAVSGCRSRIGPLHGANWGETGISRGLIESAVQAPDQTFVLDRLSHAAAATTAAWSSKLQSRDEAGMIRL